MKKSLVTVISENRGKILKGLLIVGGAIGALVITVALNNNDEEAEGDSTNVLDDTGESGVWEIETTE